MEPFGSLVLESDAGPKFSSHPMEPGAASVRYPHRLHLLMSSIMDALGRRRWAIAEGYIPSESSFSDRTLISHETACILNASERDAHVAITLFFADKDPIGPYRVTIPAQRTLHLRFNDLVDPSPVPRDTDYASVFESDVPIIVQHTRLDSRRAEIALMSTVAFAAE